MSETVPPRPPYTGTPVPDFGPRPERNLPTGIAVAALVVGVIASLTGLVPVLGLLLGIIAVVLGIVGIRRAGAGLAGGRGLSITGTVLGALAALTGLLVLLLTVVGLTTGDSGTASPAETVTEAPLEQTPTPEATETPAPAPEPAEESPTEQPEPAPGDETPGIGAAATAEDGSQYTITAFSCGLTSVGEEPFASTPQGEYCQLDLTLTNTGDEAILFNGSEVKAYAGDIEYEADAEASIYNDGNAFLEDVNPGNTLTSTLYFDVPAGTPLDRVQLGEGFLTEGVTIRLA